MEKTSPSNYQFKIPFDYPTDYMFSVAEVQALYRLILYMGWIPRDDKGITEIVHRITRIIDDMKRHELVTTDNQTT